MGNASPARASTTLRIQSLFPSLADTIFLTVLLALSLVHGQGLLGDGDTGYHIRAGEYILEHREVPRLDIFGFWDPPYTWTAHEWLSEILMAVAHRMAGLFGVVILFSITLAWTARRLYRMLLERSSNLLLVIAITYFAVISTTLHWLARPHMFSLLLMTVWYHYLDRFQYEGKDRLIFFPFLMVLWVNLHGGFIVGLVLIGIYAAGNALMALTDGRADSDLHWTKFKKLMICGVACTLASTINPQGVHMLLFPFQVASSKFILDNVLEFLSPNFHRPMPFTYLFLLMIAVLARSKMAVNWIETGLIVLFTYMALFSARYIALCSIIFAPILLRLCERLVSELPDFVQRFLQARSDNLSHMDRQTYPHAWAALGILLVFGLAAGNSVAMRFDENRHPIQAVEFLKRENLPGRMFNNDEFGDYLIYAAWPQYRVFFDGRSDMYGEKLVNEYKKVMHVSPGWEEVIEGHGIGWVFITTRSSLASVLIVRDDWRLIYSDKVASIFVRNRPEYRQVIDKYPDVALNLEPPESAVNGPEAETPPA